MPGDRIALTTFSHAVTARATLTGDFASVRESLGRIRPAGDTAVMDGAFVALMTTQAQPGRSLLVVCTDGYDTASWLTSDEVVEAARRSNAVIYAVTSADAGEQSELKELTDATGGQTMQVASSGDLADTFRRVLSDFRSRYVLAFTPRDVEPGGAHRLDVRVKRPNLTVKARPGYVGLQCVALGRRARSAAAGLTAVSLFVLHAMRPLPPEVTPASVALLERWDAAVRSHEPASSMKVSSG